MTTALLLGTALLGALLAYWPGLHGPWLYDDAPNLDPVRQWLAGNIGWYQVVFHNNSGPGGRPLSMASFLLSGALGGYTPFAFKLGNLLLHLANGVLVFFLFRAFARRDRILGTWPLTAPLAVAALWLLHPLLVSTTLYAVQRMAMLSASFMLSAMLAYCHGRQLVERGQRTGPVWIFAAMPLLTICAFFSKENGLLAPLLCGVIELVYFAPTTGTRRPTAARLFLLLGVALPIAGGLLALALWPERLLGGYGNRPFTLSERVLTESRVLFDYASSLLLPWGPRLSLFRDDYMLSTGLLSPVTTLLAVLGWLALAGMAVGMRKRVPAFSVGLGLFLVGHALESSLFPLAIYFEHRNYLPAVGLLWAVAGLLAVAGTRLAPRMDRPVPLFAGATVLLVIAFGVATHARATVWQDIDTLLASSLRHHPDSRGLRMGLAQQAMTANPPRPALARKHLRQLLKSNEPATRQIGLMNLTAIDCLVDHRVPADRAAQLFDFPGRPIEADLAKSIQNAANASRRTDCKNLPPGRMAQGLESWLDRSSLSERWAAKSRLRYQTAILYVAAGNPTAALAQADIAWNAGRTELPVGGLQVAMLIELGRLEEAGSLLEKLRMREAADSKIADEFLDAYQARLDDALASRKPPGH